MGNHCVLLGYRRKISGPCSQHVVLVRHGGNLQRSAHVNGDFAFRRFVHLAVLIRDLNGSALSAVHGEGSRHGSIVFCREYGLYLVFWRERTESIGIAAVGGEGLRLAVGGYLPFFENVSVLCLCFEGHIVADHGAGFEFLSTGSRRSDASVFAGTVDNLTFGNVLLRLDEDFRITFYDEVEGTVGGRDIHFTAVSLLQENLRQRVAFPRGCFYGNGVSLEDFIAAVNFFFLAGGRNLGAAIRGQGDSIALSRRGNGRLVGPQTVGFHRGILTGHIGVRLGGDHEGVIRVGIQTVGGIFRALNQVFVNLLVFAAVLDVHVVPQHLLAVHRIPFQIHAVEAVGVGMLRFQILRSFRRHGHLPYPISEERGIVPGLGGEFSLPRTEFPVKSVGADYRFRQAGGDEGLFVQVFHLSGGALLFGFRGKTSIGVEVFQTHIRTGFGIVAQKAEAAHQGEVKGESVTHFRRGGSGRRGAPFAG